MKNISIYKYKYHLFVIGILFFVFGFLTWVNGVLIPYFKICMQLNNFQATLVAFSAYFAYFIMAMPSALLLERIGYRKGMVLGLCIMSIGTLAFIPAAYSRYYPLFLGGLFLTGSGLALVQTAANPYIAIMGPIESTAKRIGFMGIANKIAGIFCLILLGKVKVRNYVIKAKEKGVLFDVSHGGYGFWYNQAVPALKNGLQPDTFGSDLHKFSMNKGMKSMLNIMSKYLNMGMSFNDVILRATWNPAKSIRRNDLGSLTIGNKADIAILSLISGDYGFVDAAGFRIKGDKKFQAELTIKEGIIEWDLNGLSAQKFE